MWLTISDDDFCSKCNHLIYCPGEESYCKEQTNGKWPAEFNEDGYSVRCGMFEAIKNAKN